MCAPDVDTPEPSKEEKELLKEQTETLKLIREIGKENVQVNRMLFPQAASVIGLQPVYSQDQANEVFAPEEVKRAQEKEGGQGGTDVFGSIFTSAVGRRGPTTAFDPTDDSRQVGGGAPQGEGAEGQGEEESFGTSFGDITGFKQVEPRGFEGVPEPGELSQISEFIPGFAGEQFNLLQPNVEQERFERRARGRRAEAAFERNRKKITSELGATITPEEARALLGL